MNRAVVKGILATLILLSVYFAVTTFISGWGFALGQFSQFWYYIITLAVGFGIQVGLYSYLKTSGRVLAVSGATSTAAMISCCAHYLVNFLPVLGAIGIITVISQYQVQLFWVGLAFNFTGLMYMLYQFKKFKGIEMRSVLGAKKPGQVRLKTSKNKLVVTTPQSRILSLAGKYHKHYLRHKKVNVNHIRDYIDYGQA